MVLDIKEITECRSQNSMATINVFNLLLRTYHHAGQLCHEAVVRVRGIYHSDVALRPREGTQLYCSSQRNRQCAGTVAADQAP